MYSLHKNVHSHKHIYVPGIYIIHVIHGFIKALFSKKLRITKADLRTLHKARTVYQIFSQFQKNLVTYKLAGRFG
jgi:hypothetical protein